MKKIVALILAATLCLSLCACGDSDKYQDIIDCLDDKDYSGAISLIQQMAAEDDGQLNIDIMDNDFSGDNGGDAGEVDQEKEDLYNKCVDFLNNWAEAGDASFYTDEETALSGQEAFLYMYDKLQSISDYKEANAYLRKILLVENVLLRVEVKNVDNMGNTNSNGGMELFYDDNGRVCKERGWAEEYKNYGLSSYSGVTVTYDDAGRAISLRFGDENTTDALVTRQFDKKGLCVKEIIKRNSGDLTVTQTYDKAGRLTQRKRQMTEDKAQYYISEYTYNKDGTVKSLKEYRNVKYSWDTHWTKYDITENTYTYDKEGHLVQRKCSERGYDYNSTCVTEYTSDDKGRILTAKTAYGKRKNNDGSEENQQYASKTENYIYGIYFIYNP